MEYIEASAKPSVIHYNNISTIKGLNFKERNKVLSLAPLWDNVGNKMSYPIFRYNTIIEKKKNLNLKINKKRGCYGFMQIPENA